MAPAWPSQPRCHPGGGGLADSGAGTPRWSGPRCSLYHPRARPVTSSLATPVTRNGKCCHRPYVVQTENNGPMLGQRRPCRPALTQHRAVISSQSGVFKGRCMLLYLLFAQPHQLYSTLTPPSLWVSKLFPVVTVKLTS